MNKQFIPLLLTVLMSMVGTKAFAHDIEVENSDGVTIYYVLTKNNTELAVSFRGSYVPSSWGYSGTVVIPSSVEYNGRSYSVTSIGDYAFYNCSGLTSITIPNSVTSIGDHAFYKCNGLVSIIVETGNTKYDSRNNCNAIIETETNNLITGCRKTTIPDNVTSIGDYAFYNCIGLTSVTIPNSVTSIGTYVFKDCTSLTSVTIGNRVMSIGIYAFSDCIGLTSITIPNSVTSLGDGAFEGCSSLSSITIPSSVTSIGDGTFLFCTSLTSITIPNNVTSIEDYAFSNCSGLTSIEIPSSVTSIGWAAFKNCSGLTSITIPNSVTNIGEGAFSWCSGLTSINVETGNTKYDSPSNCNAIIETETNTLITGCRNTTIPSSVTSIGNSSFSGCSGLSSITIPDNVTSIGYDAFEGCIGLTSVTVPNSVTSMGYGVFQDCNRLTSITIPDNVTSIGDHAFSGCSSLTSITIPSNVTSINNYAFYNCGLSSIISLNKTPPTCVLNSGGYYQFNSYHKTYSVVWVPRGSTNAYKEANGWKDFNSIRELIIGDANVDGVVNAADIVEMVNALNGKPSNRFLPYNADQTSDGIDASNVDAIVNTIMDK